MVLPKEDGRRDVLQREGVALPAELVARGFTLITRAPGRLFAVSEAWGCTSTKGAIHEVVAEAWGLIAFCEYVNRQRTEDSNDTTSASLHSDQRDT